MKTNIQKITYIILLTLLSGILFSGPRKGGIGGSAGGNSEKRLPWDKNQLHLNR